MGALFVISGPSGVGKGTLVKLLMKEDPSLALSISCTTRAPRKGERDGKEYFFLSRDEFVSRIQAGDFLECDEHFGNYYGTPKSFVQTQLETRSVILEIDVKGALQVKENAPDTVLVMIVPPDFKTLEQRLAGRGSETEEERAGRLERVKYELSLKDKYDYVVVNKNLQRAKRELQKIIRKETDQKGV